MDKTDVKSMRLEELEDALTGMGQPKFRAKQVYQWLQERGAVSFEEMTNLSKGLRSSLAAFFEIRNCAIEKRLISKNDSTVKYLFRLNDGELIESVLMEYKYGYTLCVSSQVGCQMGCTFCASTLNGLCRDLTASEIISQIHTAQRDQNVRISHVVLMGMGEPLNNFEQVMRFLTLVTDPMGLGLSMRHISLSTCGVVPGIYKLMEYRLPLTLSISLHAPNDAIRSRTMPVNRKWGMEELLEACRAYGKATSRRISFEYTLIDGVNDSTACAEELADRLKGILCHVNLIPVNEVSENSYRRSSASKVAQFQKKLNARGINATVRRTLGADINASCGQLRRNHQEVRGE